MATERLQPNDKRLIVAIVLVGIVAVWYTRLNYTAAFPQASINLRYSKSQITERADRFLRERNLSTAGFRNLTLFDPDDNARLYLEREMGLEEANRLMQGEVAVWRWRARWFRPPDKEEMVVFLSPAGRLNGFQHVIPEAAPGARLEQDAARTQAENFLKGQTSTPQRLIEEKLEERPNRYDYMFTWEQEDFHAKDATYRRTIVVQGDQVGSYSEYLHVPEKWQRDFSALRSSNELYTWIAQTMWVPLILAAIAVLIQSLRRRNVPWRPLILVCSAVAVLMVINQWNQLPFFIDSIPTSSPFRDTLALGLLEGLGAGVGVFFYVILAAAAGEPLYRASQPSHLYLPAALSRKGIGTKEFFLASAVGYGFAAAHIAFVVAFYLIGRKFGVWSPQDVEYSDLLSTSLPWIYPLTISLLAASSEEFWFRLLAIPLLRRYLRYTWIAVLVPAFIWGFLHANYPQQPGYIRGIEVGVVGVAAGFLMLRFGILTTLIWHYTVDAVMIGMYLFQAESWYFRLSGAVVAGAVAFPLIVSLVQYRRRGGFVVDERMLNASAGVSESALSVKTSELEPAAEPPPPRWPVKWLYLTAAAAVAAGIFLKPFEFGNFIKVRLPASDAGVIADRAMGERNLNPGSWRRVTTFIPNLSAADFEYVRRLNGERAANDVVRDRTITGVWYTRYFRPMQNEEWRVYVNQQRRAYRMDHVLDEKAPGANLSLEQARQTAEDYLAQRQQLPMDKYRLVDSSQEKRDNRTDYSFVWENRDFRVGEATERVSLSLVGDDVSQFRKFLKLPESWLREFSRPRLQQFLVPALMGAVAVPLLVVFIRRISGRHGHRFHWKAYLLTASAAAALSVLSAWNEWPTVLVSYDTAKPLDNALSQIVLSRLVVVLLSGVGVFLAVMAADVFLQLAIGFSRLPRPSVIRALAVALLFWGIGRGSEVIEQSIPGDRFSLPMWSLTGPATHLPALSVLSQGFFGALLMLCATVIVVAAVVRYLSGRRGHFLIVTALALVALSHSSNVWLWMFHLLEGALGVALVIFVLKTCGADLVSFGVALFCLVATGPAAALIAQPEPWLRWNGIGAMAAAALFGAALLFKYWASSFRINRY